MTERNTNNLDAHDAKQASSAAQQDGGATDAGTVVQAQLEANERARQILESQQKEAEVAKEQIEKEEQKGETVKTETGDSAAKSSKTQADDKEANTDKDVTEKAATKKNKTATHEVPAMAGVNLVVKQGALERSFKKNKKVWLGAGVAIVAALVLVMVGVMIKTEPEKTPAADISLESVAEWYGETPADSMLATAFGERIDEKIKSDDDYSYEDAIIDFEAAYEESEGQLQKEITYSYVYFVYNNTGDLDAALAVLKKIEPTLEGVDFVNYYSTIASLYGMAGDKLMEDQYNVLVQEYATRYATHADMEYLMQELELE